MEKITETKEIYKFTLSEVLKALKLKIPKNKNVFVGSSLDLDENEPIIEIEVSNN